MHHFVCLRLSIVVAVLIAPALAQVWHRKPFMPGHRGFAFAQDPTRGRLVLFGGGETWEWDGQTWGQRSPSRSPPSLQDAAMAYDPARQRVLLFGGREAGGQLSRATWVWDGFAWSRLNPAGPPEARTGHAMVTDTARQRIVLFGGASSPPTFFNDTWEWDGIRWLRRSPATAPGNRSEHALVYDAGRQRTVLFGGAIGGSSLDDTWEWDGSNWAVHQPAGKPSWRRRHAMAYDPANARVVLYGGGTVTEPALADTWAWDGTSWTSIGTVGVPGQRVDHALTYDPARAAVLLVAGGDMPCVCTPTAVADTWQLDTTGWRAIDGMPLLRGGTVFAFDSGRGRSVLYGDIFGSTDTWEWDGYRWQYAAATSGAGPRAGHAMTYDAARAEAVLFGGHSIPGRVGGTWVWDGRVWTERVVATEPLARSDGAMAYDAARRQVVLFGGRQWWFTGVGPLNDTWVWDGSAWTEQSPGNAPSVRHDHAMAYDPVRARVVLFGGRLGTLGLPSTDETWEWDGATWTLMAPAVRPPARWRHRMVYHATWGGVVLHGGNTSTPDPDTWLWNGTTWARLAVSEPPAFSGDITEDATGHVVLFGASGGAPVTAVFAPSVTPAAASPYGVGCGVAEGIPTLDAVGLPLVGRSAFALDVGRGAPGVPAVMLLSAGQANLVLGGGCTLWVNPTGAVAAPLRTGATGAASLRLTLPATPAVLGVVVYAQAAIVDPLGPFAGLAMTRGLQLTVGE